MSVFIFSSEAEIAKRVAKRAGERKFGEAVGLVCNWEELKKHPAKYVVFGISEDIGVRANYGNQGASKAWHAALNVLCNIQDNELTQAKNVIILGEIDCSEEMTKAAKRTSMVDLGALVEQIDAKVAEVVAKIVSAEKFPIIIGGGHNNSYGNIKGTSKALNQPINCINFDAHTDFRVLEHRHSGNGFSYAFKNGFLDKYFIFGLHRNYTSEAVFKDLRKHPERIRFNLFEAIKVTQTLPFSEAIQQSEVFISNEPFGLEIDLDAIENMGSSAMTPSGFSVSETRQFVSHFATLPNCKYVHLCEGNPDTGIFQNQVAKMIAYLVSDCISEKTLKAT